MKQITYTKIYKEKNYSFEVEVTVNEISHEALNRYVDKLIDIKSKKEAA